MKDLGALSSYPHSGATSINNGGAVVGNSFRSGFLGSSRPFIWQAGTGMVDLNSLISGKSGWILTIARSINTGGDIAGWGNLKTNGSSVQHAYLLVPAGTVSPFNAVAVQGSTASGYKIVVAGSNNNGVNNLTRYTLSGALDTSFGGTGAGSFTISGGYYFASLALEADGSIVVGGSYAYVSSDGKTHSELMVGHLSADGIVDTTFGPNGTGFSYAQVGPNTWGFSLAIDPLTGDIVLGGASGPSLVSPQGAVARFTHP